jgi:protein-tyrosine phosphatase/arsenate reductase
MLANIKERCNSLVKNFHEISEERKLILENLTTYIQGKIDSNNPIQLNYICTHNSRRSHLGQVWAAVAADYFQVKNVSTFSGGTEATAFNANAIEALTQAGFIIHPLDDTKNPMYQVFFDLEKSTNCFSKTYNHSSNPLENFAAIMTCSDADQNCPFIVGCDVRIGTTYNDPKAYDGSILQQEKYTERSNQIAMECLYVFSKIKTL